MIGTRLGMWVLDRELGRGGMGHVYLAHHQEQPDQRAAIKLLAAELATDPTFPARFQREIEIMRRLEHPNIVRYLDSGVHERRSFLAMEYIPGPSLQIVLDEKGRLPWSDVLNLALQIAPALKHAHDRGIIHRDLKPSNLLLAQPYERARPLGTVKLTDFGIASLFADTPLTRTGLVIGTAAFLSPEQAAGKPVTRRSDLYSFGAVLYLLLTGKTPFEGEVVELLHKHVYGKFELPRRLVPEIPHDLETLVCQMLDKDPSCRPADGAVLFRRLDSLRRKIERRNTQPDGPTAILGLPGSGPTPAEGVRHPGPATLMSRLMRRELELQNRGGPVQQFFNNPWVLVLLFLLSLGVIIWTFWPLSEEALYERGAHLMASPHPDDWERAWSDYLEPLEKRHPDSAHHEEILRFYQQLEAHRAGRQAEQLASRVAPMTEAQWFYLLGLRQRQEHHEADARKTWQSLIAAFEAVPSERPWVKLAEQRMAEGKERPVRRELEPLREALGKAKELEKAGNKAEAEAIRAGIKQLYSDDPHLPELLQKQKD